MTETTWKQFPWMQYHHVNGGFNAYLREGNKIKLNNGKIGIITGKGRKNFHAIIVVTLFMKQRKILSSVVTLKRINAFGEKK